MAVYPSQITREYGLVAALRENPVEVYSWIEHGQLRLVGATLADLGGSGKAGDLERRLEPVFRLGEANWGEWWNKVRPALKDHPKYFSIRKGQYELATEVECIPVEPVLSKSTWAEWSKADQWPLPGKRALPGPNPPANVIKWDILNRKGAEPERLIPRAITTAEEFLAGKMRTSPSAQKWLEMLLEGMGRYRSLPNQDSYYIGLGYQVLAQLIELLLERASGKTLLVTSVRRAVDIAKWRKVLAIVLWEKYRFGDSESRLMLEFLDSKLSSPERIALWDEMAQAGLDSDDWTHSNTMDLDMVLSRLGRNQERSVVIQRIVHRAVTREVSYHSVSHFIAGSRYAGNAPGADEQLNALGNAALLLPGRQVMLLEWAAEPIRRALTQSQPEEEASLASVMAKEARKLVEASQADHGKEMERERQKYEDQIRQIRQEKKQLNEQLRIVSADLGARREESKLDALEPLLQRTGDVLQQVYQLKENPAEALKQVRERLPMVIGNGDAELLGSPGIIVGYDPYIHQSSTSFPIGSPVQVIAPGVIFRGQSYGDKVIVKAYVTAGTESD